MAREERIGRRDLSLQADARKFERSRLARRAVAAGIAGPIIKQVFELSDSDLNRFQNGR